MSVENNDDDGVLIIGGKRFLSEPRWSKEKGGITTRTTARHRDQGLPWLDWGGKIYIPEVEGDEYLAARVVRRARRGRRA